MIVEYPGPHVIPGTKSVMCDIKANHAHTTGELKELAAFHNVKKDKPPILFGKPQKITANKKFTLADIYASLKQAETDAELVEVDEDEGALPTVVLDGGGTDPTEPFTNAELGMIMYMCNYEADYLLKRKGQNDPRHMMLRSIIRKAGHQMGQPDHVVESVITQWQMLYDKDAPVLDDTAQVIVSEAVKQWGQLEDDDEDEDD